MTSSALCCNWHDLTLKSLCTQSGGWIGTNFPNPPVTCSPMSFPCKIQWFRSCTACDWPCRHPLQGITAAKLHKGAPFMAAESLKHLADVIFLYLNLWRVLWFKKNKKKNVTRQPSSFLKSWSLDFFFRLFESNLAKWTVVGYFCSCMSFLFRGSRAPPVGTHPNNQSGQKIHKWKKGHSITFKRWTNYLSSTIVKSNYLDLTIKFIFSYDVQYCIISVFWAFKQVTRLFTLWFDYLYWRQLH